VKQAKALAAYNFGPSATVKVLNKAREAGVDIYNSLDWVDMLPEETSDYIDKILVGDNEEFEAGYAKKRKTFQLPE
jgi:membrane-bound lytic murein transglycosylase MltF